MVLKDILSISGEPGLFRFIAQGKNAIIVEHLETKKRTSVYGSSKVSSLEDIAIFTEKEDMPLSKVFDLIHEKENGAETINPKADPSKLTEWFVNILPDYAKNKVYASDIRKVAQWYNTLHKLGLLVKEEESKTEETAEKQDESSENPVTTDDSTETTPKKKGKSKPKAS